MSANADIRATNISYKNNKMHFSLNISNNKNYQRKFYEIEFSMIGIHHSKCIGDNCDRYRIKNTTYQN